MYFHFVNALGEIFLRVLSGDFIVSVFDWLDLASKQKYEKKQAIFITLLKSVFGIFFIITHMIWLFATLFSIRFSEFAFSMTKFCVKI